MTQEEYLLLSRLASAASNEALSPEDRRTSEELLRRDEDAQREWLAYSRLHAELIRGACAERVVAKAIADIRGSLEDPVPQAVARVRLSSAGVGSGRSRLIGRPLHAFAIACAAVLAVTLYYGVPRGNDPVARVVDPRVGGSGSPAGPRVASLPSREPRPVATLVRYSTADVASTTKGDAGPVQVLFEEEEVVLEEGSARLSMAGGANILLEAPVSLHLAGPGHVQLNKGTLTAKLPEWGIGFVVDTPAMRVVDLGTTFSVSADSIRESQARVLEGLITVQPHGASKSPGGALVVSKGESVHVKGDRAKRSKGRTNDQRDASDIRRLTEARSYKPIPLHNTGVNLSVGDEDPAWQLVGAPEELGLELPRYAVLCEPVVNYCRNEPSRSQWISLDAANSRVPSKSIYTFRTSLDLTGFDVDSIRLQCQILADNGVRAIRVNGHDLDVPSWSNDDKRGTRFERKLFRAISVDKGLMPGVNHVEIDVWNGVMWTRSGRRPEWPNHVALRVEWNAFGYESD